MTRISALELMAVNLPFRKPFKHAAAARRSSNSLFLKCVTDSGVAGFGECLPREYVTGESRDGAFDLLRERVIPQLVGHEFDSLDAVVSFLIECDGKAPPDWVPFETAQCAAWCAVDLALLDAFSRVDARRIELGARCDNSARFSAVVSSEVSLKTLLMIRLAGIRQVKLKVEKTGNEAAVAKCRRVLGRNCDIRADANMAWSVEQAVEEMKSLSKFGVRSFEQPIAADDLDGLAQLVGRTAGLDIMADESLNDKHSLDMLIEQRACTAVNVRISKCGGLIAALHRCREAAEAGLTVQVGCQVGESSLLSAAQLVLLDAVPEVRYLEGCFGRLLLKEDPAEPLLQFGRSGKWPTRRKGEGFGVEVNEETLDRWVIRREVVSL